MANHLLALGSGSRLAANTTALFESEGFVVTGVDFGPRPNLSNSSLNCDIGATVDFRPLLLRAITENGPVSHIMLFARHRPPKNEQNTRDNWLREFEVGIRGPRDLISQLVAMPENESQLRSVVFIGSVLSKNVSLLESGSYHVVKAGTDALVRYMSEELREAGVRVNCVAAGFISWEEEASPPNRTPDNRQMDKVISIVPKVTAGQVASVCLFLCSEEALGVSGQTIVVDRGFSNIDQVALILL